MSKDLEDLPNIGNELAAKLKLVDIKNSGELKAAGSKNTFIRLKTIDPDACLNMLYAIEGAIQEIRWHNLDIDTKIELKEFYYLLNCQ